MTTAKMHVFAKVVADLLHPGHVRFFKAARALGTHLTVCVVPDERVAAYKGTLPLLSLEERMEMVSACRWVDAVMSSCPKVVTLAFMQSHGFDAYAFGAKDSGELAAKLADCEELPPNMRLIIPYSAGISTTVLRERLMSPSADGTGTNDSLACDP